MVDGAGDLAGGGIEREALGQGADREGERHAVGVGEVAGHIDGWDRLAVVDGGRGDGGRGRGHVAHGDLEGFWRRGALVVGGRDGDRVAAGLLERIDGAGDLAGGGINRQALGQAARRVGDHVVGVGIAEGLARIDGERGARGHALVGRVGANGGRLVERGDRETLGSSSLPVVCCDGDRVDPAGRAFRGIVIDGAGDDARGRVDRYTSWKPGR